MSGTPTETELQSQWAALVDILETTRVHADSTLAGSGGKYDTLIQALEGEYTPQLTELVASHRSGMSSLMDPGFVRSGLEPIIREYAQILAADATYGYGSGFTSLDDLSDALYDHFVNNSKTVQSRNLSLGSITTSGTGNTELARLTEDENGFQLEGCHVETKRFRCVRDQTSGADEFAEEFLFLGERASQDALLIQGSGESQSTALFTHNAGSGTGGSQLRNSSFSTYDTAADNDFDGWELVSGTVPTQDTTNVYISHPGAASDGSDDASLKFAVGASARLKQSLVDMSNSALDPNTPYFCRAMVNADLGSASGGSFILHVGSKTAQLDLANFGTGWNEVRLGDSTLDGGSEDPSDCWFKNFNQDDFNIEIEWSSASSGQLIVDDLIFAPWDFVDGHYWFMRHTHASSPTSPLVDYQFKLTDTGGSPANAKIQWYLWLAGLRTLPSTTGTPTFADP